MKPYFTIFAHAIIVASLWQPLNAEQNQAGRPSETDPPHRIQNENGSVLSVLAKGSDIIGLEVRNYQDEKLGKVQDLIVDVGAGRVVGLLISTGVLPGRNQATVPLASFHYDAERKLLQLESTQEALKGSPRVDVSKWGEFQQPETVAEVYRYYRVAPYFADASNIPGRTDPAVSSGNRASDETVTANRGSDGLTPTDQGNSGNDRQTTARIRKGVMADSTLSVGAKNVKIITVNGRVTLRGKVPTEAERKLIVELAESAAPGQVDDQLQVEAAETKKY